jgi:hypothetical protein
MIRESEEDELCGHRDLNPGYGLTSHFAWKASVLTKLDDDRGIP